MPAPTVRLKIRVKLPNGSRSYVDPVFASNNKLKPLYALVDGKPRHHPEGVYHLRYRKGDYRVWESVGNDPQVALTAQLRVEHRLQAVALGLAAPELVVLKNRKTDQAEAMAEYLRDIASARSKATLNAYAHTLKVFATICSKQYMEQINRRDILNYHDHLRATGNAPRTVANRSNFLKIFFLHQKIAWPLAKTDRVTQQTSLQAILDKTKVAASLTTNGSPFHAEMKISGAKKEPQYESFVTVDWASRARYRVEVRSARFHQIKTVDGDQVQEQNEGDFYPGWLHSFVTALLDPLSVKPLLVDPKASIGISRSSNGVTVTHSVIDIFGTGAIRTRAEHPINARNAAPTLLTLGSSPNSCHVPIF